MKTVIPFGKFRGLLVENLPDWYISWLADLPDLRDPLLSAVEQECERRFAERDSSDSGAKECPAAEFAEELIGAGVRTLARRYHPDVGGTNEEMQNVNAAAAWLRSQVRRLSA